MVAVGIVAVFAGTGIEHARLLRSWPPELFSLSLWPRAGVRIAHLPDSVVLRCRIRRYGRRAREASRRNDAIVQATGEIRHFVPSIKKVGQPRPLVSSRGYSARPAPYGVSYHGRCGSGRYGPFALRSCHCGHETMAARRLLLDSDSRGRQSLRRCDRGRRSLSAVHVGRFATIATASLRREGSGSGPSPWSTGPPIGRGQIVARRAHGTKAGHLLDARSLSAVRLGRSDTDIEEGGAGTFRSLLSPPPKSDRLRSIASSKSGRCRRASSATKLWQPEGPRPTVKSARRKCRQTNLMFSFQLW